MRACENPFCAEAMHGIAYEPLDGSFGELLGRVEELEYRAAIVGPHGSGKTTLLGQLGEAFGDKGIGTVEVFVNDTSGLSRVELKAVAAEVGPGEVVLLDGADMLSRLAWGGFRRNVLANGGGLIVTSHRPGALPTLINCKTSEPLLLSIVQRLLGDGARIDRGFIGELFQRKKGDIRGCLRELYDIFAEDQGDTVLALYKNVAE